MAVATHLRFHIAVPLLLVATAMVGLPRARAVGADRFASAWKASHTLQAHSMDSEPKTCEIDQAKPQPHAPLEPRASPFQQARPVILDGVMYFDTRRHSSTFGVHRAAVSQCPVYPNVWEFGVIHRQIDSPRYY